MVWHLMMSQVVKVTEITAKLIFITISLTDVFPLSNCLLFNTKYYMGDWLMPCNVPV